MLPTEVIPCSDTTTLSEASLSYPSTLIVTFEEEEDVLEYFKDVSVTEKNTVAILMNLYGYIPLSNNIYTLALNLCF